MRELLNTFLVESELRTKVSEVFAVGKNVIYAGSYGGGHINGKTNLDSKRFVSEVVRYFEKYNEDMPLNSRGNIRIEYRYSKNANKTCIRISNSRIVNGCKYGDFFGIDIEGEEKFMTRKFIDCEGQMFDTIQAIADGYYWDVYKSYCGSCQGANKLQCCFCMGASIKDFGEWIKKNPELAANSACEYYNRKFEGMCSFTPEDFLIEGE